MSPALVSSAIEADVQGWQPDDFDYQKGVKHLCDSGLASVPKKYILPVPDRPGLARGDDPSGHLNLNLPLIDFADLQGSDRSYAVERIAKACSEFGFFQVGFHFNHAKYSAFVLLCTTN